MSIPILNVVNIEVRLNLVICAVRFNHHPPHLKFIFVIGVVLIFGVVCLLPLTLIGAAFVIPAIVDWQNQRLITVVEGSQHLLDDKRQLTGNYQQKNIFYWSSKSIAEVKEDYEAFTTAPFVEVNSYDENWFIAALKESHLIEQPVRNVKQLPADFCDYERTASCVSVMLFDAGQPSFSQVLDGMYRLTASERSKFPKSGTLIVFSYFIPDFW